MTEFRHNATRIYRHEYSTVTPEEALKYIRGLDIKSTRREGNFDIYTVKFKNQLMDIKVTDTRVIIFGLNRMAMLELGKELRPDIWEYDNTTARTDYMGGAK